jgi:hypothetical protein
MRQTMRKPAGVRKPCPVKGCQRTRHAGHVMCSKHWFMVPQPIRWRVWTEFYRANGSAAHLGAIREAIESLTER